MCDRIVVLVDMDCFYCQVETRLNPALRGKPLAVVQYNQWQGGGIIAVNYEARAFGVTRHLRGDEARKKCPDIVLISVPSVREKADISKYRDAGREVAAVFCQFTDCVERASVDEAYLDITKAVEARMQLMGQQKVTPEQLLNTFVVDSDFESNDEGCRLKNLSTWLSSFDEGELSEPAEEKLAVGAVIVEEMRAAVFAQTGFKCSAGIAHNKILAKLSCGLHKPNRQTVLPQSRVPVLYQSLPIKKVRSLGGKFGDYVVKVLGCTAMGDLSKFSLSKLQETFDEKQGTWLYNIARGIDLEQVTPRLVSKSIGCCKNFPGKQALTTITDVKRWLQVLSTEVMERLVKDYDENKRRAQIITVSYRLKSNPKCISSRCGRLSSYDVDKMAKVAYGLMKNNNTSLPADDKWEPAVMFLGISAGKFSSGDRSQNKTINSFFKSSEKKQLTDAEVKHVSTENTEISNLTKSESHNSGISDYYSRDGESFFKAYFRRLRKNKHNDPQGNSHDEDTKSEKCVESEAKLLTSDVHLNRKQISVSSEGCSVAEFRNTSALLNNNNSNNNVEGEQWISPHEIFPCLDEADEATVALLPSPMQRKIRSLETECKVSNIDVLPLLNTSTLNQCKDKTVSSSKPEENSIENMNHNLHENQFTKDFSVANHQHSSDADNLKAKQDIASNFVTSAICSPDTASETNGEQHQHEMSGGVASEICPHCKSNVLLSEYPEHLDFHLAEKLHKELNNACSSSSTTAPHQVPKTNVNMNKRKKGGNNKNTQDTKAGSKRVKNITSFFTSLK